VTVRTDRMLEDFFNFLDQRIGLRRVLIVLTADHGVAPLPEVVRDVRVGAGRIKPSTIAAAAESGLRARYGAPPAPGWVVQTTPPWIYLNLKGLEQRGIEVYAAERVARAAVKRIPQVNQAVTATLLRELQQSGIASGRVFSFYPDRSGNVYYELKPYVVPGEDPTGTTHGSPWSYDTRVPLLWLGARVKRGVQAQPATIADIAPTLSAILGIAKPSNSRGRVLQEMLR